MSKFTSKDISILGIAVAINIVGSFIAVWTKIPLLLDHIGTMMICMLFGYKYGILTAMCSCFIVGITFDWFAIPFAPTGMLMIFIVGKFLEKDLFKKMGTVPAMLLATLPASILGACIAAYIFGGITSSGSSIIVRFLMGLGVGPVISAFVIQYLMEFLDRLLSFLIVRDVVKRLR